MSRMHTLGTNLFYGASALAMVLAGSPAAALAQGGSTQTQPSGQEDDDNDVQDVLPESDVDPTLPPDGTTREQEESGAIVITGSRIRSPQFTQPNPIVSIDSSDIQNAGVTNLTDFLSENPALQGSTTSNDTSGTNAGIGQVGLNLLNLRQLGTGRTLVLVDGRRHVSAVPGSASVDIQSLPVDLIERIDIVTGGGSAVYGADAVTGVVNFVMKRDFEGISFRGQGGISKYGDTGRYLAAVTAGTNFMDGRGNVALSLEYSRDEEFGRNTRSFLTNEGVCSFYENQADLADDPTVPDNLLECDVRYYDSSLFSGVDVDLDTVPDFVGATGELWDPGRFVGSIYQVGGSGTPVGTYSAELLPQTDRYVGNLLLNFDVTDALNVYAQGKYARIESKTENQVSFDFFLRIRPDNAFLTPVLRQALTAAGNTSFGALITGRDNFDLGRRGSAAVRETYRGVVGATMDFNDNIRFDASYVYGRVDNRTTQTNYRFNDRFFAALDAVVDPTTGNIVCRSNIANPTLSNQPFGGPNSVLFNFASPPTGTVLSFTPGANSGCVPFNPFIDNRTTAQGQAAINWINTTARDFSQIQQHVATAVIDGNLGDFRLAGGPIGFAVGAEYRKEIAKDLPDPIGITFYTFGNRLFETRGDFDVREAFAELRVPIIADRPFFEELTVTGAARVSDYSTVGTQWTWQLGAMFAPVRDIRFRGSYSNLVRAPNIAELFGPTSQTFAFFNDPCAPANIDSGEDVRASNCEAIFQELNLTPAERAAFTGALSASVAGLSTGNPNLDEERAKNLTAGVVLQPRWVPGLALSTDYYDIRIENAVSTASAQTLAVLCVDQPRPNQYCEAIDRAPTGSIRPGVITGFRLQPANVAEFRSSGIDFAANYRTELGDAGTLNLRLVGNRLLRFTTIPVPGGNTVNSKGIIDLPLWTVNLATTLVRDPISFTWRTNYFSPTYRVSRLTVQNEPDIVDPAYIRVKERWTHDLQLNIRAGEQMAFYFGVNNVLNQLPDVGLTWYPVPATGRYFYAGARLDFDGVREIFGRR